MSLYSESKERGNRFLIALKMIFPFLLLLTIFILPSKIFRTNVNDFVLFLLLVPIYVYYIFYLIYYGFQTTLIDFTTQTFNRREILKRISKTHKRENTSVVLLHVENISDINDRYGVSNGDLLLKKLMEKINLFLKNYNFKNIPIGRYGGGNFLLIIPNKKKELKHLLTIFSKELRQTSINHIEVKVDFSLIESNYDKNVDNIIEKLFNLLEESKKEDFIAPNIKPDEFRGIILDTIKTNKLFFKYQPVINVKNEKIEILEILTKIYSKEHGSLSKSQVEQIVNYAGLEKVFDEKTFAILLDEVSPLYDKEVLFSVNVSAVSLRNNEFRVYLINLFHQKKINPNRFILDISEKNFYKDITRFKEILLQYKKAGFQIALDNFGGNNCSIEYLKHLPIDIVKFDIEFTKKITDTHFLSFLEAYYRLAKALHVKTMMKFVDKEEIFEKIKRFKPDFLQGFFISKPQGIHQIITRLEEK